ncbi:DUF309 domain-containing protein [Paenibacillus sp. BSR1-1]|uniref:DUF309 domain-containing protein n=1 Tax=Paenibacillus sp. BSR1-1 TaxID=3020845 RepID=UPI0025B20AAE|nr:DUF309 domain-containing protein [Paenibacillus sp. BSR1-1]MDN3016647.1 DUF309 domain-containing protein [Paenibacillus sp. BSR1-1]
MYPIEYVQFLAHFHGDRDYFECHEILEEFWKKTDPGNKESIWVGLIQLAVSCYHYRRGNYNGAARTLEKAIKILESKTASVTSLGLNQQLLHELLMKQLSVIKAKNEYMSINLPISDPFLIESCKLFCDEQGFQWGEKSDITNVELVDRHRLRDRTEVIEERYRSLKMRKSSE